MQERTERVACIRVPVQELRDDLRLEALLFGGGGGTTDTEVDEGGQRVGSRLHDVRGEDIRLLGPRRRVHRVQLEHQETEQLVGGFEREALPRRPVGGREGEKTGHVLVVEAARLQGPGIVQGEGRRRTVGVLQCIPASVQSLTNRVPHRTVA